MVSKNSTKIIDFEFATFGPIGYDIGNVIGSFLINWAAQEGLTEDPKKRNEYREYLVKMSLEVWESFKSEIEELKLKEDKINKIWQDTLGYAGTEMIRRTIGLGHIEDIASIKDENIRKKADTIALKIASDLIKSPSSDEKALKEYFVI